MCSAFVDELVISESQAGLGPFRDDSVLLIGENKVFSSTGFEVSALLSASNAYEAGAM